MQTILEIHGYHDLTDDPMELQDLIEEEISAALNNGDTLGCGEWLASKLQYADEREVEEIVCRLIALWASPHELKSQPTSIDQLISRMDEFVPDDLAPAVVTASLRAHHSPHHIPTKVKDLAFRLSSHLSSFFEIVPRRQADIINAAIAKLEASIGGLLAAVNSFKNTNCLNAKVASIEIIKKANQVKKLAIPGERAILGEIDILLGPSFRKFCENCERHQTKDILKRVPDLKEQVQKTTQNPGPYSRSVIWNLAVLPTAKHVEALLDEATRKSEAATTPSLKLSNNIFKLDLKRVDKEMTFSCRLVNHGEGRATEISLKPDLSQLPIDLHILEPRVPFEIGHESEQIVTFGLTLKEPCDSINVLLRWKCQTLSGRIHEDDDLLIIEQQRVQPDWMALSADPPYRLNPIKRREDLYGRDTILDRLVLHATSGMSTFLWGQKRVGKTSILQVLAGELAKRRDLLCVVLRMGEIGSLHEGQIGHRIAQRICEQLKEKNLIAPDELYFGAGLGGLIPFIENLVHAAPQMKFTVIIDEFDDLNPAFYTGQRGKAFVKALRSLSEIGLTFFFVGSERMNTIYQTHEVDLNKWVNVSLDCIESREDCKALITQPVVNAMEYQPECVDFIVDYSGRNPFYMHLLCYEIFSRCYQENRTYVGESDLQDVRQILVRKLGQTNFSHFWDDNPEIDEFEKARQSAENCLLLCCLIASGGSCETLDELFVAQDALGLGVSDKLSAREIRTVTERLQRRKVLTASSSGHNVEITLPIFKDWLVQYAQLHLLRKWQDFCAKRLSREESMQVDRLPSVVEAPFPIPEDDLLTVSQSLFYLGRQKDVTEIRVWLKQFDDEIRIG